MAVTCTKCGKTNIPDNAHLCPNCNTMLSAEPSDTLESDILEGATMAMPNTRALSDSPLSTGDTLESDIPEGATMAMPDSRELGDPSLAGNDTRESDVPEGATMAMPDSREAPEGFTVAMRPDLTTDASDISDELRTKPGVTMRGQRTISATIALKVGELLQERYRLDSVLGRGGYGAAYLAQDVKLKRVCVVKQMLTGANISPNQLEEQRQNFEREASLLVKLNHPGHPNIPEIYDYFYDDTGNYLVMKYIEGHSLKEAIEKNNALPWEDAVRYITDVCSALNYMHTQGDEPVMHRDVKPANILLGNDGRVWLVDFGLAKADPKRGSTAFERKSSGSLGYTPLEQWLGDAEPASDVYAAAATLHYMITGLNPLRHFGNKFDIQKIHQFHGKFESVQDVDRNLPLRLDEIIAAATAADPKNRPTALQLQQQLTVLISGAQDAALFTFKNGESAKTVEELVDLCEENRKEAQTHLFNSDFERWFLLINRNDLASAANTAVKQSKNERDGLEKFLKLIMPNLAARRTKRIVGRFSRLAAFAIIIFLLAIFLFTFIGSYILGQIVQRSIASGVTWTYSTEDLTEEQVYSETYLSERFNAFAGAYFDEDVQVDITTPDHIEVSSIWGGYPVEVDYNLRLSNGRPRVYITSVNEIPLSFITNNISHGINAGIDDAFENGPVDITSMQITDDRIIFTIDEGKPGAGGLPRPTLPPPQPTATPLPPTPTPTFTPTPVNVTLVVIFNDLNEPVDIEIEGQAVDGGTWQKAFEIPANRAEVIEPPGGQYNYVVRYKDGFQAATGKATWTLRQAYRVRITPDLLQLATPEPSAESN